MVYDNVVELCQKKGISICVLEKEAGLGNGAIGKWRKSPPNLASVDKVAKYFGVSVAYLVRERK